MVVADVPDPVPAMGQILCRTLACGICGSDLHFVRHGRRLVELGGQEPLDFDRDIFMGHEFAAEVLEPGPDTLAPPAGTVVTSLPGMLTLDGPRQLAYTNDFPGGYGEYLLLSPPLLLEVPNGLAPHHAAMTEPMAVGAHAVAKSDATARDAAVVCGCGPVGLAVIAALRLRGVEVIVAADPSPARRALAVTMGATEAVDPTVEPAVEAWRRIDGRRPLVLFEAVGVPGMLDAALRDCPAGGRIVVVGVCMEPDHVLPAVGIMKELQVQFVLAYSPEEFSRSLRDIAEGRIDVTPMITGRVGLADVPAAFEALTRPDEHCKIVVEPALTAGPPAAAPR
jgi:threonine dehydrogenase-like Zn-dependent dehydrogenase